MKSIILGAGEVGNALYEVLSKVHACFIHDPEKGLIAPGHFEFYCLHVCFPYSDKFVEQVKKYQEQFKPKFTVIHSTVPPGTSRQCNAIHSAIVGKHPNLVPGIQTFIKFLAGEPQASQVANYFNRAGLRVYILERAEAGELFKLLDTTYYGLEIEFTKEVKRQCQKFDVPFEGWTVYNQAYNDGYTKLGYSNHVRPNLVPIMTEIKGHCVSRNYDLLETVFTKLLKELNEKM